MSLQILNLHKSFGALRVTRDVSLDVRDGEIHALIGPNGAGKTTLIGQIMGALPSDSGHVRLGGRDITALAPHLRARAGLARSFQITQLAGSLSALENVALAVQARSPAPLRPWGRAAQDSALNGPAQAVLAQVGLSDQAGRPANALSHGERRALEIACALALDPVCVLFDEPLAGMAPEEGARIVALLQGLRGRFAMLLVEHDMDAVFALADRVSVLVAGQIIATGTPAEMRADPAVRAAYLGGEA